MSFGKFNLSLNPLGWRVPNFMIQKSSRRSSKFRICSLVMFFFDTSSITIILKSLLKLWFGWSKCRSIAMESDFLTSFGCLFTRRFVPCTSTFPTYCSWLHFRHIPRYMAFFVLQLVLCLISNRSPVRLVKKLVLMIWLQHMQSERPLHGLHLPRLSSRFLT